MDTDHAAAHSSRRLRLALGLAIGAGLAALATIPLTARAASHRPTATSAVVVKVATRGSFGRILTTVKGRSLYEHPGGPCTDSCLSVWPPLLMPKGATVPKGVSGLGTKTFTGGRLQVTYMDQPLFTFVSDSGTSVIGNGVGGFVVAKVK